MKCPQCQQPLREGAQFCTNCGTRSVQMPAAGARGATGKASAEDAGDGSRSRSAAATFIGNGGDSSGDPFIGRVLDSKYELLSRLGEGGMGMVYRARRVHIGDEVAVKLLHSKFATDDAAVERFRREARAAAQLHHPNVVTIHDYGEVGGRNPHTFIVMELVPGESLREVLKRVGRFTPERAIALMQGVCAGVGAAHRRNIVHRDIKPDNIIIIPPEADGEPERAKVVDFGIAKLRDLAAADNNLTQTGSVVGTPYYMSPEQCRGDELDARSDVYSLGALLYEMLAGAPPFVAQTMTGIVAKHLTEAPAPFAAALDVPPALESVVLRTLAKNPDGRPADAAALARELQTTSKQLAARTPSSPESIYPVVPSVPAQPTMPPVHTPTNPPAVHNPTGQTYVPPHTGPQSSQVTLEAAAPQSSRSPLLMGVLLIGGIVLLGGIGIIALLLSNTGNTPETDNRNGTRPTPAPTASRTPTPPGNAGLPASKMGRAETLVVNGEALDADTLKGIAAEDLRLLRNTVFARHGRVFNSPELKNYFDQRQWYVADAGYDESSLTAIDRNNIALIQTAETSAGADIPSDPNDPRNEARMALEGWAQATRVHDLDGHLSYYAPTLDTYYKSSGVSLGAVRADRERAFTRFTNLDIQLSNINISVEPSGTRAVAVFNKEWDFDGKSTGMVRQQVVLTKIDNEWRITSEKDLAVLSKE